VRDADSFPSANTTVGPGQSLAWNQWARVNDVMDAEFHVRRDRRDVFLAMAESLHDADNAFDARGGAKLAGAPASHNARRWRSISVAVLA
jgi:hypothetical protein